MIYVCYILALFSTYMLTVSCFRWIHALLGWIISNIRNGKDAPTKINVAVITYSMVFYSVLFVASILGYFHFL